MTEHLLTLLSTYKYVVLFPLSLVEAPLMSILGGFLIAHYTARLTSVQYWSSAYQALDFEDIFQGLIKPVIFSVVVAGMGCYFGLRTRGGTEGVGRATTQAMVAASVVILILDFFITKLLISIKFG